MACTANYKCMLYISVNRGQPHEIEMRIYLCLENVLNPNNDQHTLYSYSTKHLDIIIILIFRGIQ